MSVETAGDERERRRRGMSVETLLVMRERERVVDEREECGDSAGDERESGDRESTRLNSSHTLKSRMPSSA